MKLPPYDPAAKCPKCGGEDVITVYVERDGHDPMDFHNCRFYWPRGGPEHHDRICQRCHFQWAEGVIDTRKEEATNARSA